MVQEVTLPAFVPCQFGKDYTHSEEYRAMSDFLLFEATPEQLRKIHNDLQALPTAMEWNGQGYPQDRIQEPYWIWQKGASLLKIESFFVELLFLHALKRGRQQ